MLGILARHWWVMLIRGIAAILFGILAFMWPGLTLLVLAILFGVYALVDGATALGLVAGGSVQRGARLPFVVVGILGIIAALVAFLWPGITAMALIIVIAVWAIVRGVLEIIAAVELRKAIHHEWLLGLAGALSIVFGVLVLMNPGPGAIAVAWLIAAYAVAAGVVMIALSLRLRRINEGLVHPDTGGTWRTA